MTIAALLNHFGVGNVRYITVAGEVVFDGVKATAGGGYTHVTRGTVTRVQPHTFHAGEEGTDTGDENHAWWNEAAAITPHIEAMTAAFPDFTYVPGAPDGAPCWIGKIDTSRGTFTIGVVLRRDRGLPRVRLINGPRLGKNTGRTWQRSPHLYLNGNLCVAGQDDWDPDTHTAATVTAWAAHWLAAYTLWRITGRWPTEGVSPVAA